MAASAVLKKDPPPLTPSGMVEADAKTVLTWLEAGDIVLVDVRETAEYEQEHIPGAVLCPMSVFDAELFPVIPGKRVVLHCAVGKRSAAAAKQLLSEGYDTVTNLEGGIKAWKAAGCPTEVQLTPPDEPGTLPMLPLASRRPGDSGTRRAPALPPGTHPGRILKSEFLEPLGMSQSSLARAVGVSPGRISGIVAGRRRITADTALRLARHLCTSEEFWLRLQAAHDLDRARRDVGSRIAREVEPRRGGERRCGPE